MRAERRILPRRSTCRVLSGFRLEEREYLLGRRKQHEERTHGNRGSDVGVTDRYVLEDTPRIHDGDVNPTDDEGGKEDRDDSIQDELNPTPRPCIESHHKQIDANVPGASPGLIRPEKYNPDKQRLGAVH